MVKKFFLNFILMNIFLIYPSFAVQWETAEVQYKEAHPSWFIHFTGETCGRMLNPMTEAVADSLDNLERTKIYNCEVKVWRGGKFCHDGPLFDIRNCTLK